MKAKASSVVLLLSLAAHAAAQSSIESEVPATASSAGPASGVRVGFWWADYDRDGLEDAFAIGADGAARLLHNSGDGSFADVTLITGLDGLGSACFAAWQDFDRDGSPDVFVGTQTGPGHLMRNAGDGTFQDVTQFVGLTHSGKHLAAQWFDYDLDGFVDLAVRTDAGEHLYHALPNAHFEAIDLGNVKPRPIIAPELGIDPSEFDPDSDASAPLTPDKDGDEPAARRTASRAAPGATGAPNSPTHISTAPPAPPPGSWFVSACPPKITDTATNSCLQASSVPTLGMLYPLTINLNVNAAGNVGIGTTSPSFKLDVAGAARVADTLTLNPAGDVALHLATGSIYKEGALFMHTKGGGSNTALGKQALSFVTTGRYDTASGYRALQYNDSGSANTAVGEQAMRMNTTGSQNTAVASYALRNNTTGRFNTATGYAALFANTTGSNNSASGFYALRSNTTGDSNTASGSRALFSNTAGYRNTATGFSALRSNTTGLCNTASGFEALYSNTTGNNNTASGTRALFSNTTGWYNTASGYRALFSNTAGTGNTASGFQALFSDTTGAGNTAIGFLALRSNTTGQNNTASGNQALAHSTTGAGNTADGEGALYFNTTGSRNTALGYGAGANLTTGNDNIAIGNPGVAGETARIRIGTAGTHAHAFIAGIRGITTLNANAIPVLIDSAGQLGTVSSSRRFKKDIVDMGDATSSLLELRPVRFRYKQEQTMPDGSEVPMEYGLIAEEVAQIFPDLVVYDDEGKPFTVKYHILSSMLLNELKKQAVINTDQQEELTRLRGLEGRLAALEARSALLAPATSVPREIH